MKNKALETGALVGTVAILWACAGGSGTVVNMDLTGGPPEGDGAAFVDRVPERSQVEEVADLFELHLPETTGEATSPDGWNPAPGEAGAPCENNGECDSGFCILTAMGSLCTTTCQEECPYDWKCVQHVASLPDIIYICSPGWLDLCRPCRADNECRLNGVDAGQACIDYGPDGGFCGEACQADSDCPEGFVCEEAGTLSGLDNMLCTLAQGECGCSAFDVELGAATDCYLENDAGLCWGERSCDAKGLSACTAPDPAQEECNSLDDDCDGAVDEDLSGGECLSTNQFGTCPGTKICMGGQILCEGEAPKPETCDGADNDCDGETDEGFPDTDLDGTADCLEADIDGDGVADPQDNCPAAFNPGQDDFDFDNDGDACDADDDDDKSPDVEDCAPKDAEVFPGAVEACDGKDNDCNFVVDEGFTDADGDGWKDCVDDDDDGDGAPDAVDCQPTDPAVFPGAEELCDAKDNDCDNAVDEDHPDLDDDGVPDCLDEDTDGDGAPDSQDNCPMVPNPGQENMDGDFLGDLCDDDVDGDSIPDAVDNCTGLQNPMQSDVDSDGLGDDCDNDIDGDGHGNADDNCPLVANPAQEDKDGDGTGNACEEDSDGDGAPDADDCAPLNPAVFPGAMEECDSADNDCDGLVDEGYPDTDTDGLKDCVDDDDDGDGAPDAVDCQITDPAVFPGAQEFCNGADDNCDGKTDEGLGVLNCGKGQCAHSMDACVDGVLQLCDPYEGIAPETCDGVDNDCDGLSDEDQGTSTCGLGACFHSVSNCVDGEPQECDPLEGATEEQCDGLDNDCDAKVDEEMPVLACGKGQCFHTQPSCVGGTAQECEPFLGALPEGCDGLDNDCDGPVDEDLGTTTCGMGGCEHTVENCANGVQQVCNPLAGAAPEECDGLDNDCNGQVDDGLGGVTCGLGICQHSAPQCVDGTPQECDPVEGQQDEACDGLDNDCDGAVDNGFVDTDGDGDADCVDEDDDGDGAMDDDDCAPLDPATGQCDAEEVCQNQQCLSQIEANSFAQYLVENPNAASTPKVFQVRIDVSAAVIQQELFSIYRLDLELPYCFEQDDGECMASPVTGAVWVVLDVALEAGDSLLLSVVAEEAGQAVDGTSVFDFAMDFNDGALGDWLHETPGISAQSYDNEQGMYVDIPDSGMYEGRDVYHNVAGMGTSYTVESHLYDVANMGYNYPGGLVFVFQDAAHWLGLEGQIGSGWTERGEWGGGDTNWFHNYPGNPFPNGWQTQRVDIPGDGTYRLFVGDAQIAQEPLPGSFGSAQHNGIGFAKHGSTGDMFINWVRVRRYSEVPLTAILQE